MRDYALDRAAAADSIGSSLVALYHNWQARRETGRLARRDAETLSRYGFSKADVDWALKLPLSQNALLALEDRAFRRSRGLPVT